MEERLSGRVTMVAMPLKIALYTCTALYVYKVRQGIKRHLLLGRKVMTNLHSILKSRDITLPIKVLLVKAVVFLVIMYGCES